MSPEAQSVVIEQRRHARAPLRSPLSFSLKGKTETFEGVAKDISVGGMFVETTTAAPFGAEIVVHLVLPGSDATQSLPGVVRWVRTDGMGVQFGLLGARETHLITEINRKQSG